MILLILISGNANIIIEKHRLSNEIDVIKVDEKDFYDFKDFIKKLKQKNYKEIHYGCLDIQYQRFTFFMHFFNLVAGCKSGSIIDELGNRIKIRTLKTIFYQIPLFIVQSIIGLLITIIYFFRILYNKWRAKV